MVAINKLHTPYYEYAIISVIFGYGKSTHQFPSVDGKWMRCTYYLLIGLCGQETAKPSDTKPADRCLSPAGRGDYYQ